MQATSTARYGNFNRLTAALLGLALLAVTVAGAIGLADSLDLAFSSSGERAQIRTSNGARERILLREQNIWEQQAGVNIATSARIRFVEDNAFDYESPTTAAQIKFREENIWERHPVAQPANAAPAADAVSGQQLQFLEENVWEQQSPMLPPYADGATDY